MLSTLGGAWAPPLSGGVVGRVMPALRRRFVIRLARRCCLIKLTARRRKLARLLLSLDEPMPYAAAMGQRVVVIDSIEGVEEALS